MTEDTARGIRPLVALAVIGVALLAVTSASSRRAADLRAFAKMAAKDPLNTATG